MKINLILVLLIIASGCASPSKTPEMDKDALGKGTYLGLKPRTINIKITNHRVINAEKGNSKEVEQSVAKAVGDYFERSDVKVNEKSKNRIEYDIVNYDGTLGDSDSCVKLKGSFYIKGSLVMSNEAYGCYTLKHAFGFKMGSNIDKAYEQALSTSLAYFDQNLR